MTSPSPDPTYTVLARIDVWGLLDELLARGLLYPETVLGCVYDISPLSQGDGTIDIDYDCDADEVLVVEFPPEEEDH